MSNLFIDDFVISQGHKTTEDYLTWSMDERLCPRFNSVKYYQSLLSKGLIREGFSIRTSDQRVIDRHYWVDSDGNLVGANEGPYPGEKGTFKPEEILIGERISSGWTIESFGFFVVFREYMKSKKQ